MFSTVARLHRTWCDADPQGSEGGWDATMVQQAADWGWISQPQADEIIATGGHVGNFQTMSEGQLGA